MMHRRTNEIQRPMQVYSEMYDTAEAAAKANHVHSLSLGTSLLVSFLVIAAAAWGLHLGEAALNHLVYGQPETSRTVIGDAKESEPQEGLHWSTIAKKLLGVQTAHAAPRKGYEVFVTRQSRKQVSLAPGETTKIYLRFKNIGTKAWTTDQSGPYISLYTREPNYRKSAFANSNWFSDIQPAILQEDRVEPQGFGHMVVELTAPQTEGSHIEKFKLAAEETTWIPGGEVVINVNVAERSAAKAPVAAPPATVQPDTSADTPATSDKPTPEEAEQSFHALRLIQSHKSIKAVGGQDVVFRVGFKNIGDAPWVMREIRNANTALATTGAVSPYAHTSWLTGDTAVKVARGTVQSGQLDLHTFTFRTPAKAGEYSAQFQFYVAGVAVEGGLVTIPVTVTADAPSSSSVITFEGQEELGEEPRIRVGLYKIEEKGTPLLRSPFAYQIVDASGDVLAPLPANTTVSLLRSSSGKYIVEGPGISIISNEYLRLEPTVENAYIDVINVEDRPKWNTSLNYNGFRDTLEIRYAEKNEKTWLINELPLEQYVAGVAEISNGVNHEAQKALMTAVRTYAFHQIDSPKHRDRHFDVDAKYDQVYKGYYREKRFDRVGDAVNETRGELVTYQGDVVITPYYSRSDGRTRAWTEVWGGSDKPWLQSVKAEYDAGRTMWGHGVGMSARDMLLRAEEEDMEYPELLAYYYRGTQVQRLFE